MKKIIIEILQNSKAEYKFIATNIPLLLVLLGGNIGYGVLYNYMYNPNIVRDVPIAVVDMADNKLSHTFIKNIDATEQVAVKHVISDYAEAETMVKENKIVGFLYLPRSFSHLGLEYNKSNIMAYGSTLSFLDFLMIQEATTYTLLDFNAMLRPIYVSQLPDKDKFAIAQLQPIEIIPNVMFNTEEGYGTYLLPPVLIIIIFQTMMICISNSCGNERENKKLHISNLKHNFKYNTISIVLGKILAYFIIFSIISTFMLGLLPIIFDLPHIGRPYTIVFMMIPFLIASAAFALCLLPLYTDSEKPLIFIVFMSIILLFFSGISYPLELMSWYWKIMHYIFPAASAALCFVKINTMGADISQILPEITTLWTQSIVYLIISILVFKFSIKKKYWQ